ncbi:hypothetical protein STSP2_00046 [Anaerohalosphaera lusitana]|uniref:Uncharacterized protein n=1 Tax=Anaerohalosphaera lusitana TaxID=1936003 RepID=A0A1U9NGM8_9BACT|nr:hypothetical protein STSP2_00046 [Anaerohalosphaera lusitana]
MGAGFEYNACVLNGKTVQAGSDEKERISGQSERG